MRARKKGKTLMPVDPQVQAMLDELAGLPAMHTLPVDVVRAGSEKRFAQGARAVPVGNVENRTIPGPGGELKLRIYTPVGKGPFPLIVFFHGSGFVICSLDTHDTMCRHLCAGASAVVVSVDYRLAPEHKFPAAPDDCLAATRWAAAHCAELNADPTRIALAGDSAGGNLAAVTALRVRDEGGPALCAQLLIYPVTDADTNTPSYQENAEGYGLTRDGMIWFWGHYLDSQANAVDPHVSPLRAKNLSGLPPAFVLTAEYDPLRDEGEFYANRLTEAGVPTRLTRYDGVNHGFFFWYDRIDTTRVAVRDACAWLKARFLA
jgi:acetyl esterase